MPRKLFGRPAYNPMYSHGYSTRSAAEMAEDAAALAQDALDRDFGRAQNDPQTVLGKIFPRAESLLRRRQQPQVLRTLKLENLGTGYDGLARALQELADTPMGKKGERDVQLASRLKAITTMAHQIERGEFSHASDTANRAQDIEALLALDRLMTLNKGSGKPQKHHRVETFLNAARADYLEPKQELITKRYRELEQSIRGDASQFNNGIDKFLTHRPSADRSKHYRNADLPADSSVEKSGIYARFEAVLHSKRSAKGQWNALTKLAEKTTDAECVFYQTHDHVFAEHLNYKLRHLVRDCNKAPLSAEQRVALVAQAIEQFRPAAQHAHVRADEKRICPYQSLQAAADAPKFAEMSMGEPRAKVQLEPYVYPKGHRPRWYNDGGMAFMKLVLGIGLPLTAGVAVVKQDNLRAALNMPIPISASANDAPMETEDEINTRLRLENLRANEEFNAGMEASEQRLKTASDIRNAAAANLSKPKPYRDDYRGMPSYIKLPPYKPVYDSPEEQAYHECLDRTMDPVTYARIGTEECVSPDIKKIQDEAAAKYGSHAQPATAAPADDLPPPPISDAPKPTPAMISYANEAFPTLAASGDRTSEPLQTNVTVNFDMKR